MKNLIYTLFSIMVFTASISVQASSVVLRVSPPSTVINGLGANFTVNIFGHFNADTAGVDTLLGGAADLTFDPSILEVTNVTVIAPADIAMAAGLINNITGNIDTFGFASFSGVNDSTFDGGDFGFATVEFETVGFGTSLLGLSNSNDLTFEWADSNGGLASFSAQGGFATVVPVPATIWMFASGLVGLFQLNRKKLMVN